MVTRYSMVDVFPFLGKPFTVATGVKPIAEDHGA